MPPKDGTKRQETVIDDTRSDQKKEVLLESVSHAKIPS